MIGHGGPYTTPEVDGGTLSTGRWWRLGWLVDANGSARWEPCERPLHPLADALAERYGGEVVRLLSLPDGYATRERLAGGATVPVDPAGAEVEAVVTRGWPGGPRVADGTVLIGPLPLLMRHGGPGHGAEALDGGFPGAEAPPAEAPPRPRGVDWVRVAAWSGAVAFSGAVWLGVALLVRALLG